MKNIQDATADAYWSRINNVRQRTDSCVCYD